MAKLYKIVEGRCEEAKETAAEVLTSDNQHSIIYTPSNGVPALDFITSTDDKLVGIVIGAFNYGDLGEFSNLAQINGSPALVLVNKDTPNGRFTNVGRTIVKVNEGIARELGGLLQDPATGYFFYPKDGKNLQEEVLDGSYPLHEARNERQF